jgi:hypothetical protein
MKYWFNRLCNLFLEFLKQKELFDFAIGVIYTNNRVVIRMFIT